MSGEVAPLDAEACSDEEGRTWACQVLERHSTRAESACAFHSLRDVFAPDGELRARLQRGPIQIFGRHRFYGLVPMNFSYRLDLDENSHIRITLRIHLRDEWMSRLEDAQRDALLRDYAVAADIWQQELTPRLVPYIPLS